MSRDNMDIRDAFLGEIYKIIKKDKNTVFLSDDMDALILRKIKKEFPKQYVNVGVQEQNIIDVAAGLATFGKKVFVFGICSYITLRCFEQIKFSIASMKLPVVIVGVGPGFSFSFDGPTHHSTTDVAIMRTIPDTRIFNPIDAYSSKFCASLSYKSNHNSYVRLDKGAYPNIYNSRDKISEGLKVIKPLTNINIFSTGYMTHQAVKVADLLSKMSIKVGIVDVLRLKPVNDESLLKLINKSQKVVVVEENSTIGGLGSIMSSFITGNRLRKKLITLGVKDHQFLNYGDREYLLKLNGLDPKSISKKILESS